MDELLARIANTQFLFAEFQRLLLQAHQLAENHPKLEFTVVANDETAMYISVNSPNGYSVDVIYLVGSNDISVQLGLKGVDEYIAAWHRSGPGVVASGPNVKRGYEKNPLLVRMLTAGPGSSLIGIHALLILILSTSDVEPK